MTNELRIRVVSVVGEGLYEPCPIETLSRRIVRTHLRTKPCGPSSTLSSDRREASQKSSHAAPRALREGRLRCTTKDLNSVARRRLWCAHRRFHKSRGRRRGRDRRMAGITVGRSDCPSPHLNGVKPTITDEIRHAGAYAHTRTSFYE